MRIGLTISVLIGGLITAWIMLAGTMVGNFSSFGELATLFQNKMGVVGSLALGLGLFAAGFSSAITSPYAASLIASTVFGTEKKNVIRLAWMSVLFTGFAFGISGIKPIPVILAVQALNGLILPLLTYFLILIVNDPKVVPSLHRHSAWYNLVLLAILGTTLILGLSNVDKAITSAMKLPVANHFEIILFITSAIVLATGVQNLIPSPWRLAALTANEPAQVIEVRARPALGEKGAFVRCTEFFGQCQRRSCRGHRRWFGSLCHCLDRNRQFRPLAPRS